MTTPLLMFNDPRLGLRPNEARSDDVLTRVALRILDDALAADGDRVLSAPAIGIPVRALAMRQGADVIHLLNPSLSSLSDVVLNRGETSPQTGPMRRNTWRARTVTLSGWQAGGLPFSRVLEGPLAIGAQQAIDLLDNQQSFSWITPFHRSWAVTTNATARARAEGINRGLHPTDGGTGPLRALDDRRVAVHGDDGQALCVLDSLDPSLPIEAADRQILAVMFAASAMRHVLVLAPEQFGVAVAALALVPGLTVHHETGGWPLGAVAALDLGRAHTTARLADPIPAEGAAGPRFDAIVLRGDAAWLQGPDARTAMRRAARRLSGDGGVMMVRCATPLPEVEDLLQASFPVLYLVDDGAGQALYVAAKARLDLAAARARLLSIVNQTDHPALWPAGAMGWQLITKSGDRIAQ
ncbi:peptide deformylase [Paracoccus hibiscisoli]|uniref:Uncharacterized protein n=1 Tax=Paracoccus hibiscisoli TaxID=2023261 RepID=A0A4U0QXZ7_9RHOB|nr:peptide deformylase [Paracoccus hibiscisoli]TJZ87129.1 hypothetical protein FA740_02445 [Paracoccus hibiscisoli]